MPIYDFDCHRCGRTEEAFETISSRLEHSCIACGHAMVICLGFRTKDANEYSRRRYPYYDESLDRHLSSEKHKREVLKEMNITQVDGFFSKKKRKDVKYFT